MRSCWLSTVTGALPGVESLKRSLRSAMVVVGCLFITTPATAFLVFEDAGATAGDIQAVVDAYRAALGAPLNGNAPGPLADGRREINWDGGGPPVINGTAPATPFIVFQNTRGATFSTPGDGLTQAAATGGLLSLDLINPSYASNFAPFSPNRLFTPLGSNITHGVFSIPGTGGSVAAGVRGFGAVFSDVDLPGSSIEYFDAFGDSLGVVQVPSISGDQTFSFVGITLTPAEGLISRVAITTGTTPLGPTEGRGVDVVVMDDFLYGEPQRLVSEPHTMALLSAGLAVMLAVAWRRSRRGAANVGERRRSRRVLTRATRA
jgi:hypothetical protein